MFQRLFHAITSSIPCSRDSVLALSASPALLAYICTPELHCSQAWPSPHWRVCSVLPILSTSHNQLSVCFILLLLSIFANVSLHMCLVQEAPLHMFANSYSTAPPRAMCYVPTRLRSLHFRGRGLVLLLALDQLEVERHHAL